MLKYSVHMLAIILEKVLKKWAHLTLIYVAVQNTRIPTFSLINNAVTTFLMKQKEKKSLSEHQANMHKSRWYSQEDVWNKQKISTSDNKTEGFSKK